MLSSLPVTSCYGDDEHETTPKCYRDNEHETTPTNHTRHNVTSSHNRSKLRISRICQGTFFDTI